MNVGNNVCQRRGNLLNLKTDEDRKGGRMKEEWPGGMDGKAKWKKGGSGRKTRTGRKKGRMDGTARRL